MLQHVDKQHVAYLHGSLLQLYSVSAQASQLARSLELPVEYSSAAQVKWLRDRVILLVPAQSLNAVKAELLVLNAQNGKQLHAVQLEADTADKLRAEWHFDAVTMGQHAMVAVGCGNMVRTVMLSDKKGLQVKQTLKLHAVSALKFNKQGDQLFVGSLDGRLTVLSHGGDSNGQQARYVVQQRVASTSSGISMLLPCRSSVVVQLEDNSVQIVALIPEGNGQHQAKVTPLIKASRQEFAMGLDPSAQYIAFSGSQWIKIYDLATSHLGNKQQLSQQGQVKHLVWHLANSLMEMNAGAQEPTVITLTCGEIVERIILALDSAPQAQSKWQMKEFVMAHQAQWLQTADSKLSPPTVRPLVNMKLKFVIPESPVVRDVKKPLPNYTQENAQPNADPKLQQKRLDKLRHELDKKRKARAQVNVDSVMARTQERLATLTDAKSSDLIKIIRHVERATDQLLAYDPANDDERRAMNEATERITMKMKTRNLVAEQ